MGLADGENGRKWCRNQSSNSSLLIQPESDKPFVVHVLHPHTFLVLRTFCQRQQKVELHFLLHCNKLGQLFELYHQLYWSEDAMLPSAIIAFGDFGSKGMSVLSQLKFMIETIEDHYLQWSVLRDENSYLRHQSYILMIEYVIDVQPHKE